MRIIGLTGKARAGKDTAAGIILKWCEEQGLTAERLAFADPLKLSAAAALGFDTTPRPDVLEDAVAFCNTLKEEDATITVTTYGGLSHPKVQTISGRAFLQLYGTEAHRGVFGSNFWVEVMERKLAEMAGAVDVAIVTDVRFPNEATMVNRHGGEVGEVTRADNSTLKDDLEAHSSEVGLPEGAVEFQIANDGTIEDLWLLVRSVCDSNLKGAA